MVVIRSDDSLCFVVLEEFVSCGIHTFCTWVLVNHSSFMNFMSILSSFGLRSQSRLEICAFSFAIQNDSSLARFITCVWWIWSCVYGLLIRCVRCYVAMLCLVKFEGGTLRRVVLDGLQSWLFRIVVCMHHCDDSAAAFVGRSPFMYGCVLARCMISCPFIIRTPRARAINDSIGVFLFVNLEIDLCIFLVRMKIWREAHHDSGARHVLVWRRVPCQRAKFHATNWCASSFAVLVPMNSTAMGNFKLCAPLANDILGLAPRK